MRTVRTDDAASLGTLRPLCNRVIVSDALELLRQLPDSSIPLFLFSPPYNLSARAEGSGGMPGRKRHAFHYPTGEHAQDLPTKTGHYSEGARFGKRGGMGKWSGTKLAEGYAAHSDDMTPTAYRRWQRTILRECWRTLTPDGAIYYNHKPRVLNGVLQTPLDFNPGLSVRQIVIWARAGGINFAPTHYCPTHEWLVIFAKSDFRLRDKAASGVGDVWRIPQESGTWHPAPFPLKLAERVLETTMPSLVCDPFVGRGTTAVAAKRLGIDFIAGDVSAEYVARANTWLGKTRYLGVRQATFWEMSA